MYEKLGELLNEALQKGSLPSKKEENQIIIPASLHKSLAVFDLAINADFEQVKNAYQAKLDSMRPQKGKKDIYENERTLIMNAYDELESFFFGR